ncbi:chorion peroxidase-like [Gordionus sp. m RMFG-2023]|uniref:chorion peroxidase-like n=1 Tax=Gordionus sp. m RMFG-2023 TaxID=3053472 RepID=UPI0031FC6684
MYLSQVFLIASRHGIINAQGEENLSQTLVIGRDQLEKAMGEAMERVEAMSQVELKSALFKDQINDVLIPRSKSYMKIKMGFVSVFAATRIRDMIKGAEKNDDKRLIAVISDIAAILDTSLRALSRLLKTGFKSLDLNGTMMSFECPYENRLRREDDKEKTPSCDPYYREIDGYCNNLKYPFRGMANYPAQRFIPADYGDGLSSPRLNRVGGELPNPRMISEVLPKTPRENFFITNMVMTFGQLLDHEFALASSPTGFKYGKLKCCKRSDEDITDNDKNPLCFALKINASDNFYEKFNLKCMEVVRSFPVISRDCHLGSREQNNEITSFIDASPIYGSSKEISYSLRTFDKGLMLTQPNPRHPKLKHLLPVSEISFSKQCEDKRNTSYRCFASGDERVNENTILIAIHTLFVREHNRIANGLLLVNPHWNDEKIYQESRRILAAEIQHITYNEFLPIIIGETNMRRFGLNLQRTGHFHSYNQEVDATVDHGFVTAAFRFGHSLINPSISMLEDYTRYRPIRLQNDFFQPEHTYGSRFPSGLDPIFRGIYKQNSQMMDHHIVEDVRDHLFRLPSEPFGMDLISINLLRGREHGVPSYNTWREFCGMPRFEKWTDMIGMFPAIVFHRLSSIYSHPEDIDLFIGGVSEFSPQRLGNNPSQGLLGPTFACIVGHQFNRFKYGDRFWYENSNISGIINHAFTTEQLQEIRKVSLSKVVCDNSDRIFRIPENVFLSSNNL